MVIYFTQTLKSIFILKKHIMCLVCFFFSECESIRFLYFFKIVLTFFTILIIVIWIPDYSIQTCVFDFEFILSEKIPINSKIIFFIERMFLNLHFFSFNCCNSKILGFERNNIIFLKGVFIIFSIYFVEYAFCYENRNKGNAI